MQIKQLQERNRIQNRIEMVLEGANLKLGMVVSDVLGLPGIGLCFRTARL